ncbi:SAM-dependent methyltransferase [Blastochloris viridis]|uniref:Cyclopropane-fatty-acyl-phospholipid synthase n=1 Tax=Blastochloris viridis TaxID=1079 RepID=A0A0H5BQH0_BLAVI|nr:cyclopropane-fatty-acyl-phospholipid synthase family protein [Blastochloris viridis]ALK09199.1 Cyclopropane-fatty-acyl-phospholipid synthase [Blastochloris viridis]BAS00934.1 cyclopropane-fatty-acyl-phospholipid synthase [Blastochloris viridis]CUU41862.1 Cyclopropane-fatty-acyl-phospholipid synthase [Blastochloris viridis]
MRLLATLLKRFVRNGKLTVIDHDGATCAFGSGQDGPTVTVRFHDDKVARQLFLNPELAAGEAYMDGRLTVEDGGTVFDLLRLFSVNRSGLASHPLQQALRRVWRALKRVHQSNPLGRAAKHARHHYDHPAAFYRLWLDETMSYSCAYFAAPDMPLAEAQRAKMRHIAAKLKIAPGMSVVEIGSGWGGLACYLAKVCGATVTAINVSPEQIAAARQRAEAEGVADRVTFVETDYRQLAGTFDRLVSVGMMEHVGVAYFDDYFSTVKRLLKPGGFGLVHAIGRMSPPGSTAPFIRKHIFPGGYVPALSEVFASTERTGLWVADCEVLRLHYYWTIKHWRERFAAERDAVVAMMGERFARMWEFYLAAVELGFLDGSNMVFQLLLAEKRDSVPVIRDYITDAERALAGKGG